MGAVSAGEVLVEMVRMFSTGDLSRLRETIHAEYLDHQGLGGEPVQGPDGFASVVAAARSSYKELTVTVADLIEANDRAAARLKWEGTRLSGEQVARETLEIVR